MQQLRAPFPWFGGKSRAASLIWERLGEVANYVEPFAGSLAVLLGRPTLPRIETVNDKDAFLANFWRALQAVPAEVAHWCDRPVNEADQHAVHCWLVEHKEEFTARLMGDPDYYDAQVAGWWVWGLCCWIGSGWCSGNGSWGVRDGQLIHLGDAGRGVQRQLIHLGDAGRGVQRQLVHLGDAGRGVQRQLVHLGNAGQGIQHKRPHVGVKVRDYGNGIHSLQGREEGLLQWLAALAARLRNVRVCCGDWLRVMGPSVTWKHGLTGIVLDPPYSMEEGRDMNIYRVDDGTVAHAVRAWCLEHGQHPMLRIALCGYGNVHDALLAQGWTKASWRANGGMSNQQKQGENGNKHRERIWFSPACILPRQLTLFDSD